MSKGKKKSDVSALKIYLRLLVYSKPFVGFFVLSILGFVLSAYYTSQFGELLKDLVNNVSADDNELRHRIPMQVVIYTLLRSVGAFIGAYFIAKVSWGVVHQLRIDTFNHISILPQTVFDARNSNHFVSVITYNINGVTSAVTDALKTLLQQGSQVIILAVLLVVLNWKLTLLFATVTPVLMLVVSYAAKRMRRLTNNVQISMGDITQVASEMINGVRIMRAFGGEVYEKNRMKNASQKNYIQNLKIAMTTAISTPLVQVLVGISMAILIYAALTFTDLKNPGTFVQYITTVGLILNPIRKLGEVSPMMLKGVAAAESIFELLDQPAEVDKGSIEVQRAQGAVRLEQVSFAYPNQEHPALDAVDLTVAAGEVVALVGRSGSGKTTLVNLLPRFYSPTAGRIAIDDIVIDHYTLANLREQISVVNQQVTLFEGSVADNIAYGRIDKVSREDIKRAADLAYATEFIEQLPHGFDTQIGEGGARLSGGQRQRLAIARAILKDAPILILDEATSALDNESERYIQAAMEHVMKGRTTFVIAHRLSTIEHADRIIVMENGKIVEQGTHKELLDRNGAYTKLHAAQFHGEMSSPASF